LIRIVRSGVKSIEMNRKNNCEDCQLEDTVVYPLKYGEQKGLDTPVAHTLERA